MTQPQEPSQPPQPGTVANGHVWTGTQWIPLQGEQPGPLQQGAPHNVTPPQARPKKPLHKRWWVWLLGFLVLLWAIGQLGGSNDDATPAPSATASAMQVAPVEPSPTPEPAVTDMPTPSEPPSATPEPEPAGEPVAEEPEANEFGDYPPKQQAFVSVIEATIVKYEEAETDLQRSKAVRDRNKQLVADLGGRKVTDWVGVIKEVGANGEGKAYVQVEIADGVLMKTWNNAFSDISDDTLIPESSPMFDVLLDAKSGDRVTFSGTIAADSDATIRTSNLTETFSVMTPEFIVKFSSITKS